MFINGQPEADPPQNALASPHSPSWIGLGRARGQVSPTRPPNTKKGMLKPTLRSGQLFFRVANFTHILPTTITFRCEPYIFGAKTVHVSLFALCQRCGRGLLCVGTCFFLKVPVILMLPRVLFVEHGRCVVTLNCERLSLTWLP